MDEIINLIENAEQGSSMQSIEEGKAARLELDAITKRLEEQAKLIERLHHSLKEILPMVTNHYDSYFDKDVEYRNAEALLAELEAKK